MPLFSARPGKCFSNDTLQRNYTEIKMKLHNEYREAQNGLMSRGQTCVQPGGWRPRPAPLCPPCMMILERKQEKEAVQSTQQVT